MKMKIVLYGNPTLRVKSAEVDKVDDDLRKTLDEMVELMRSANGVGLAANQVDIPKRFFVLEVEGNVKKVVNPEIIGSGEEMVEFEEGCLSIPGVNEDVSRLSTIIIEYQDENFNTHRETFSGLVARVIQHEYDHIEGILFTDKLSVLKKKIIKGKLNKISEGNVNVGYKMRFPK